MVWGEFHSRFTIFMTSGEFTMKSKLLWESIFMQVLGVETMKSCSSTRFHAERTSQNEISWFVRKFMIFNIFSYILLASINSPFFSWNFALFSSFSTDIFVNDLYHNIYNYILWLFVYNSIFFTITYNSENFFKLFEILKEINWRRD